MHESEKLKWSRSVVSDSSHLHGVQPTRLFHPWGFPGKSTGVGSIAFSMKDILWLNQTYRDESYKFIDEKKNIYEKKNWSQYLSFSLQKALHK